MIGLCLVVLINFMKFLGFILVVVLLFMGWKYIVWLLFFIKFVFNRNVIFCLVLLNNDRGVIYFCFILSFFNMIFLFVNWNFLFVLIFLVKLFKLILWVVKVVKSYSCFFFLFLRKRFLLCVLGRWLICGIMVFIVNIVGCLIVFEVIFKFLRYFISFFCLLDILEMFFKIYIKLYV